jgi:hypothetical protein
MYLRCFAATEALLLLLLLLVLVLLLLLLLLLVLVLVLVLLLEASFQSLSAARLCWPCHGKRRAILLSPAAN